jgi:hypothetical protein
VKTAQISSKFAIDSGKISVVPHGHITLEESLTILKPFSKMHPGEQQDLCLQIVHDYLCGYIIDPYVRNFDFTGLRFIFYTSQIRPTKNICSLIRAFHKVLHENHEPIKLILTGTPSDIGSVPELITELGLKRDVLFLPRIPTRVMAALYHLSALAVNPTLFEGGFPFTFSEAYSVGTPSVMSRIPVVEEYINDPDLQTAMLFDPYNVDDIAERIYWGLQNRDELFDIQRSVYERLKSRSLDQVAREYADVINRMSVGDGV